MIAIHVFLAAQLALPIGYYACRADRHDERFAWRMFSSTRMLTCRAEFTVDAQPVRLSAQFHEAWLTLAKRGRMEVIQSMAEALCERNRGKEVRVNIACKDLDGDVTQHGGGWDVCAVGGL
jgi:hypothetical protein